MAALHIRAGAGATFALFAALSTTSAFAHAVCGDRIFPATLGIDDPGVGDELALPTLTAQPPMSTGQQEFDATFSWTKTIFSPDFGISVQYGPSWVTSNANGQGAYGSADLSTEAKYKVFCLPDHEFMGSVGLTVDWGFTGSNNNANGNDYTTFTPVIDIGKGFGDLPTSLNILRPIAITAELSEDVPNKFFTNGGMQQNTENLNWGFTVQYSLPYYNSHVAAIDNDFVKHLIPLTELVFSAPINNVPQGGYGVTGTIQPGVVYSADKWQFALEAILPINGASGKGVGVVGELHFYFDDIFPDTLGKPLFQIAGGKS
jgi:hypothetical protein